MNAQMDKYTELVDMLETATALARSNRRIRNEVRADLRKELLRRLSSGGDGLIVINQLVSLLEKTTEEEAEARFVAEQISKFAAEHAWELTSLQQV